jgi:hypothetical protein
MKYPKIADELNKMAKDDQDAREKFFTQEEPKKFTFAELVQPVDEKNYIRIVEIVDEIGYPTISKVGKKASFNAWLIVQHHSRGDFQKRCLELMEKDKEDVNPQNIAYLKDRILAFAGKKQIYGTQVKQNEVTKKMELFEVEDLEHLNERRASIGLEPIEEYMKQFGS